MNLDIGVLNVLNILIQMCGISALYILDKKGRVVISRHFRPDLSNQIHDIFNKKILEYDQGTLKPIIKDKDNNLFYFHRHNDLNFVAISRRNNNAIMVFTFLHVLVNVLESYFKQVREEAVRDNFCIIYELLDQMMDNGYPQNTEVKLLKGFIKMQSFEFSNPFSSKNNSVESMNKHIATISNVVSWRQEGIKYAKNEFFLDVVEKLSMLIGPGNNIIKSEIIGEVNANCQLSGMPDLRLGLNDKAYYQAQGRQSRSKAIEFDDIKFHQCVRLGRFQNQRLVTFIPPDGQFQLMSYRLDIRVKPLFTVDVDIETPSPTRILFQVRVKSNYKERSIANNVQIFVPVPQDVQNPSFQAQTGNAVYVPQFNSLKWTLKQFAGHKQFVLSSEFKLPTIISPKRNQYKKQPVNIKFEIPFFTVSGFQVRYLKIVDSSGYKAAPWVKYLTKNGEYQIRMK